MVPAGLTAYSLILMTYSKTTKLEAYEEAQLASYKSKVKSDTNLSI